MVQNLYRVEVDYGGCEQCGAGKTWTVVGPDDIAVGISFETSVDADELCEMLNAAADEGRIAERAEPRESWQTARELLLRVLPVNEMHGHCWCDGPDNPGLARHKDTCPARILQRFEDELRAMA